MSEPDRRVNPEFAALLLDSHFRLVGRRLEPRGLSPEAAAHWLYELAPFSVLAHDTAPDPVFTYANRTAQRLFGYEWARFTTLPSRESAGLDDQAQRDLLMDSVRRNGFTTGYRGVRLRSNGESFPVSDLTLWNLDDDAGTRWGQAAAFPV